MRKYLALIPLFVLVAFTTATCPFYFNMNVGDQIEMQSFDEKNKLTSISKQSVTEKSANKISFKSVTYSPKEKEKGSITYDVLCENGNVKVDMKSFLDAEMMKSYDPSTINVDASHLDFPSTLTVGQTLSDGYVTVKTVGAMAMIVIDTKISNRKVASKEDVTTPAGTFNCYKITYDVNSKIGFVKVSGSGAEWYSMDKGMIKSESYDKKGVMSGYTVRSK